MEDRPGQPSPDAVTELVQRSGAGDRDALAHLLPVVYDELRRVAAGYLRRERPGGTLQPTALVHEAYLRLLKDRDLAWENRAHFYAIAAQSMRQILVERARARHAQKRGGGNARVTFEDDLAVAEDRSVDLLALDAALERLATFDPDGAKIVELRYFGGLTLEETAAALGVSLATVKRHWAVARAWLKRELLGERPSGR